MIAQTLHGSVLCRLQLGVALGTMYFKDSTSIGLYSPGAEQNNTQPTKLRTRKLGQTVDKVLLYKVQQLTPGAVTTYPNLGVSCYNLLTLLIT